MKQRDVYQTSSLLVTHRLQDAFTMASHYFDREQNKMVPVARRQWRVIVHTTFLILRDEKIIFEGHRGRTAALPRSLYSGIPELGSRLGGGSPLRANSAMRFCMRARRSRPSGVPSTTF